MHASLGDHGPESRLGRVAESVTEALAALGNGPHDVLDVGGGTGGMAVPLARRGHRVRVLDPSPDSLAALERRADEAGVAQQITAVQGDFDDIDRIVGAEAVSLVVCHGVLEVVDDRAQALRAVTAALVHGGILSVLTVNRLALVVQRAVSGRFAEARGRLDPATTGPVDRGELHELVTSAGLQVLGTQGIRTLTDLVPAAVRERDPRAAADFEALELACSRHPELAAIATQVHVLARRP